MLELKIEKAINEIVQRVKELAKSSKSNRNKIILVIYAPFSTHGKTYLKQRLINSLYNEAKLVFVGEICDLVLDDIKFPTHVAGFEVDGYVLEYAPTFSCQDRSILNEKIKKKFGKYAGLHVLIYNPNLLKDKSIISNYASCVDFVVVNAFKLNKI